MKKYLIGNSECTLDIENGFQPFIFVDEITKDDLLRIKNFKELLIINLIEGTFYSSKTNEWLKLKQFKNYMDQYKNNG